MKLSERMPRLGTETAFEVLVRARALEAQGREVIHLEIGEPDFNTPDYIVQACIRALQRGAHHYGPSAGLPELRQAIAEDCLRRRGIRVEPDNVVVTPGAKPIIFFTLLALVDPGDEVIYPNPGFPIYESMINYLGGKPVPIRLIEEEGFVLDVDGLVRSINNRTKLIILNTPHNPTGGVIPRDAVMEIGRAAAHHGIPVLSDEIYSRILYEGEHFSIAQVPGMLEQTIILDGFSKTYAMTGWRLGYGIMPKALAQQIARLQTNSNSCTATFTQLAGITALRDEGDEVRHMVAEFQRRRDFIVNGLNEIDGMSCVMPRGAFYVFPNITGTGWKSKPLADYLLEEAGVACLSGTAFGSYGEGYLRFSYANSIENIDKALRRMAKALAEARPAR
ncbi:MAG: pyridoxal phosphate-dependent aminotransferase [Acidobacteria bacterium]|nr:MAG: pyridoxal phosphate-dependent aminotransferase [Acidobacteriota bacterium]